MNLSRQKAKAGKGKITLRRIKPVFLCFIICFITCINPSCSSTARYRARRPNIKYAGSQLREGTIYRGKASYYGKKFHGKKTASGDIFNMYELTAAHKSLPFGTRIQVTNLTNKKSVIVRINDRGPFIEERILDLSYQAAKTLDMLDTGIAEVSFKIIRLGVE